MMHRSSIATAFALLSAGALAGLTLTIACTDGPETADAQTGNFLDPAEYARRVYRVSVRGEEAAPGELLVEGTVSCNEGDTLLGGGCWAYHIGSAYSTGSEIDSAAIEYNAMINGPDARFNLEGEYVTDPPPTWRCAYKNNDPQSSAIRAHAHAICFRTGE